MTENIPATDSPAINDEQPVTDPNTSAIESPATVVVGVESGDSTAATDPGMGSADSSAVIDPGMGSAD